MSKRDYYDILGVPKSAPASEVKTAFRNLARKYHPDVSEESDAEERFKELNEAYAVLSDDEKRAAYDRYGHAGLNGFGGAPDFSNIDLTDIFEELFGFGFGGRGGRQRQSRPRRGGNLQYVLDLEFEEAIFGIEHEIEFSRDEVCSRCDGKKAEPGSKSIKCPTCQGAGEIRQARQSLFGSMVQVSTCPTCRGAGETIETHCIQCHGSGIERKRRKKMVEVPAGVDNGTQIRLTGEGQLGSHGAPPGDLYLILKVKPHKYFRRKEFDILLELDINIAQATLGADVEVPTVDGLSILSIPSGTQPGKVLRMRDKGVPHLRNNNRGDQLVIINVEIPKRLTKDQRELVQQLAESLGSEVHPQERGFIERLRDALGG